MPRTRGSGSGPQRDRVLLVPLAEWTAPLRDGDDVDDRPAARRCRRADLMALDGLHANALGTWYVLDKLDHYIEAKLPGTPKDALVFARPHELAQVALRAIYSMLLQLPRRSCVEPSWLQPGGANM